MNWGNDFVELVRVTKSQNRIRKKESLTEEKVRCCVCKFAGESNESICPNCCTVKSELNFRIMHFTQIEPKKLNVLKNRKKDRLLKQVRFEKINKVY